MTDQAMDRPTSRQSLIRRYKWQNLTQPEKEAVYDAAGIAATRAGVGLGLVVTTSAILLNARKGKASLPGYIRYGGVTFFSIVGAYVGFLTGGPLYARRILSVPDSKLAEDLRIVVGDWQARVPETDQSQFAPVNQGDDSQPQHINKGPASANATADGQSSPRAKAVAQDGLAVDNDKSKSLAYRLGLSKS